MLSRFKKTFSYVLPLMFAKPNRLRIVFGIFLNLIATGLNLFFPYLLKKTFSNFSNDTNSSEEPKTTPAQISLLVTTAVLGRFLFPASRKILMNPLVSGLNYKMPRLTMKKIARKPYSYFVNTHPGDIHETLVNCSNASLELPNQLFNHVIPTSIDVCAATILLAMWYGWPIVLGMSGTFLLSLGYSAFTANKNIEAQLNLLNKRLNLSRPFVSMMGNFEGVILSNNVEYELERVKVPHLACQEATLQSLTVPDKISLGNMVITAGGIVTLICLAPTSTVLVYLLLLFMPLNNLFDGINKILGANILLENIVDQLKIPSEANDNFPEQKLHVTQGTVSFHKVSFGFPDRKPILNEASFTAPGGKVTVIVGGSGVGKTTLVKLLLCRLYDVQRGQIKIDGQDIAQVSLASLRSQIGVVPQPQSIRLINGTLRENIRYGIKGIITGEDEKAAIINAGLSELVAALPKGLDTKVGERGAQLSGGQIQRVSLARALLQKPKILVLDEATSGLDAETEMQVQAQLEKLAQEQHITIIKITHRLSTIKEADHVVVLEQGEIKEEGPSQKLLVENGCYARLWRKYKDMNDLSLQYSIAAANDEKDTLSPKPADVKMDVAPADATSLELRSVVSNTNISTPLLRVGN